MFKLLTALMALNTAWALLKLVVEAWKTDKVILPEERGKPVSKTKIVYLTNDVLRAATPMRFYRIVALQLLFAAAFIAIALFMLAVV